MSYRLVYLLSLLGYGLSVGCGSAGNVDPSKVDGAASSDPNGKRTDTTTTNAPKDASAETCELQIKQEQPAVVSDLDSVKLDFTAAIQGTKCSIEIDGIKRDTACGAALSLRGTDFGVGFHTARLRSELGGGRTSDCTKVFRIAEPWPCHYTFVSPTRRSEVDNEFDTKGRRVREVQNHVTGGSGQTITDYQYQGDSLRIESEVTTYKNVPGVDNSRRDTSARTYILGPTNALGLNEDLVKNLAVDYLADGKVDVRQSFFYDIEGRLSVVEIRSGDDPALAARWVHKYDARGLLEARADDTNADGVDDMFVTIVRDKWGVLQSYKSTWQGGTSWTYQYLRCGIRVRAAEGLPLSDVPHVRVASPRSSRTRSAVVG